VNRGNKNYLQGILKIVTLGKTSEKGGGVREKRRKRWKREKMRGLLRCDKGDQIRGKKGDEEKKGGAKHRESAEKEAPPGNSKTQRGIKESKGTKVQQRGTTHGSLRKVERNITMRKMETPSFRKGFKTGWCADWGEKF